MSPALPVTISTGHFTNTGEQLIVLMVVRGGGGGEEEEGGGGVKEYSRQAHKYSTIITWHHDGLTIQ